MEKTWKLSVSLVSGGSFHSFVTKWVFTVIVISTIIPLTMVITHWKQETAALWQEFSKSLQQFINWALTIYGLMVFILWILSSSFIFSSSLPGCHVAVIPWLFLAVPKHPMWCSLPVSLLVRTPLVLQPKCSTSVFSVFCDVNYLDRKASLLYSQSVPWFSTPLLMSGNCLLVLDGC